MKGTVVGAGIISVAIILHGLLAGGRYAITSTTYANYIFDKWTGAILLCSPDRPTVGGITHCSQITAMP